MIWFDEWLERLSLIALVTLPVLLAAGGYFAIRRFKPLEDDLAASLRSASTSRLVELLRLVGATGTAEAWTIVVVDIAAREQGGRQEEWWELDDELHRAAASVCTAYDHVAGVINFDSGPAGQFFLETWGEDVIRAHDILERYLDFRRRSGMPPCSEFTWLAQEARRLHHRPRTPASDHPVRTIIRHLQS